MSDEHASDTTDSVVPEQVFIWLSAVSTFGAIRAQPSGTLAESTVAPLSDFAALRKGFLTNVLNSKTTIFIISLFMQVVRPDTPMAVQIGYGAFISGAHMAWFSVVALCFSASAVRERLMAVRHWIDRAFGGLLVGFGILLAVARGGALTEHSRWPDLKGIALAAINA